MEVEGSPSPPADTDIPAPAPVLATAASATPGAPGTFETEPYVYIGDADSEEYKRSFASNYLLHNKPRSLFVMTLGMPEFSGILDRPPLSIIKRKDLNEAYVPKAGDLKHEVKRRAHFFMNVEEEANYFTEELKRNHPLKTRRNKIVIPQPNQWLNTNLKKWLSDRPMKPNDMDIAFLQNEVNKALSFLGNESLVEASDIIATPKITKTSAPGIQTTATANGLSLPSLLTDEHSYTSVADTDDFKRSAAMTYNKLNCKPRVIIAMALGMIEYQGVLDRPPFATAKRKDQTDDFMPRAEDYRYEIKRRAHFFLNVEDESQYFTKDLQKKHPLENMRGVVSLPQPAQWKTQALRGWLSERPLKPNKEDSAFIQENIQKILDSLEVVMDREKIKLEQSAKKTAGKMPWGTANASGPGAASSGDSEELIFECINKQDAVLEAVNKQTRQQGILGNITILNQAISGFQADTASLRSTLSDMENRILQVEMKIAEAPDAAEKLGEILSKQNESKKSTEDKIMELQQLIDENRNTIGQLTKEMDDLATTVEDASSRKRKHDETAAVPPEETEDDGLIQEF